MVRREIDWCWYISEMEAVESIENVALHGHYFRYIFLLIIQLMVSLHYSGSFTFLFGYP